MDGRGERPPGERAVTAIEQVGQAVVIRLAGELDLSNAGELRDALAGAAAESPERIVVDLSEVEFVDSTALGVLVEGRARLANGHAFLLAGPGLETRRALQVSGLDRHLAVYDEVAVALAAPLG